MKYLIFDIDGTLTNTTKVDDKCYVNAFESFFNVGIKDVQWDQITNVTDCGIAEELILTRLDRASTDEDILSLKMLFLNKLMLEYDLDKSQFQDIEGASDFYKALSCDNEFHVGTENSAVSSN